MDFGRVSVMVGRRYADVSRDDHGRIVSLSVFAGRLRDTLGGVRRVQSFVRRELGCGVALQWARPTLDGAYSGVMFGCMCSNLVLYVSVFGVHNQRHGRAVVGDR